MAARRAEYFKVWLYATVSTRGHSYLRSLTWWFGNRQSCYDLASVKAEILPVCSIVTLVKAGRAINATR